MSSPTPQAPQWIGSKTDRDDCSAGCFVPAGWDDQRSPAIPASLPNNDVETWEGHIEDRRIGRRAGLLLLRYGSLRDGTAPAVV